MLSKEGRPAGDAPCATGGRRCRDVAVVGIRKFKRPDQRLVSRDQGLREMLAHGTSLGADASSSHGG